MNMISNWNEKKKKKHLESLCFTKASEIVLKTQIGNVSCPIEFPLGAYQGLRQPSEVNTHRFWDLFYQTKHYGY